MFYWYCTDGPGNLSMVRLLPTSVDYRFAALAKRASLLLRRAALLRWIMPCWAVLSRLEYAGESASDTD